MREEVASLERVQDLGNLELLMLRLPELVGSPLSINALREDLQVSHKTVAQLARRSSSGSTRSSGSRRSARRASAP